ncbi:MAG: endonuclease III domain-containing protein [bacterium]|nr:endonuclease III domain-containing protein [bacterium]
MLKTVFERLLDFYGPQHWWPGETPFEVIVGAVLTQNTNWTNVEKAIANLKRDAVLTPWQINGIEEGRLAELIRPSGYFNIKAGRLKSFISFLFDSFEGDLDRMFALEIKPLRHKLLEVKGIGPETADSILLYAGNYPIFVVDAYTKRIFSRIGLIQAEHTYHQVQEFFMDRLESGVQLFNEYHALIVRHAKEHCRTKPLCNGCPLVDLPCRFTGM